MSHFWAFVAGGVLMTSIDTAAFLTVLRQREPIEQVADSAVRNMASAYESHLDSSQLFQRFRTKYERCLEENAKLKGWRR